jgi:hypothetical protein
VTKRSPSRSFSSWNFISLVYVAKFMSRCIRCQRFGKGYCDGYENDPSQPRQIEQRLILPKERLLARKFHPVREPSLSLFKNQTLYKYSKNRDVRS